MSGDLDVYMILVDHRSSELWKDVKLQCFLLLVRPAASSLGAHPALDPKKFADP